MDQIGKYEVLDKIGSGGFAVVYKGYDPFIKRPVAIKICLSNDAETRKRFYREAEVAGRLAQPADEWRRFRPPFWARSFFGSAADHDPKRLRQAA